MSAIAFGKIYKTVYTYDVEMRWLLVQHNGQDYKLVGLKSDGVTSWKLEEKQSGIIVSYWKGGDLGDAKRATRSILTN
jgi:hypothetical protein